MASNVKVVLENFTANGPSGSDFTSTLSREIKSVESITLQQMFFQVSFYSIDSTNNCLRIKKTDESGTWQDITMTPGIYTDITFAGHLQSLIVQALPVSNSSDYAVSLASSTTLKMTISNSVANNFELNFNVPNSACWAMGYLKQAYAANTSFTSPNCYNLAGPAYLVCQLDTVGDPLIWEETQVLHNTHFIIPITEGFGNYYLFPSGNPSFVLNVKIPHLRSLRVKIFDPYGHSAQLNGGIVSLVLLIKGIVD